MALNQAKRDADGDLAWFEPGMQLQLQLTQRQLHQLREWLAGAAPSPLETISEPLEDERGQQVLGISLRWRVGQQVCDMDWMQERGILGPVVARLLTEAAVETMAEPDVASAIDELRRSKPYLFRRKTTQAGAMPARISSIWTRSNGFSRITSRTGINGNRMIISTTVTRMSSNPNPQRRLASRFIRSGRFHIMIVLPQ